MHDEAVARRSSFDVPATLLCIAGKARCLGASCPDALPVAGIVKNMAAGGPCCVAGCTSKGGIREYLRGGKITEECKYVRTSSSRLRPGELALVDGQHS